MGLESFHKRAKRPPALVDGLILQGHTILLGGFQGSAKSWFAEGLAVCVSYGEPFLGLKTTEGKVILIDQDSPIDVLSERLERLARGLGRDPNCPNLTAYGQEGFSLDSDLWIAKIRKEVKESNVSLIILDALISSLGKYSLNDMTEPRQRWGKMKLGATLVIVHHLGKKGERVEVSFADALLGSIIPMIATDTAYSFRGKAWPFNVKEEKQKHTLKVKDFSIDLLEDEAKTWAKLEIGPPKVELTETQRLIMPLFYEEKGKLTVKAVDDTLAGDAGINKIRDALHELEHLGVLIKGKQPHNRYTYRMAPGVRIVEDGILFEPKSQTHATPHSKGLN